MGDSEYEGSEPHEDYPHADPLGFVVPTEVRDKHDSRGTGDVVGIHYEGTFGGR